MQFIADGNAVLCETPGHERCALAGGHLEDEAVIRGWQRLEATAFMPTQSHAFAAALAHTLLAGTHVELFQVPGEDGVRALLPLCRYRGYFTRWRMMGAREVFEPGDALSESPEATRLLAQVLARQGRPMVLDRVPEDSLLAPALEAAMKGRGWVSIREAVPLPTIALDESWKSPESRFNSGRRSDFRRSARKADEFGKVSYEVLSPGPEEFDALFDEAIGVELRSWKKEAGTAIAADRGKEQFFRDFFRACCARGQLRIAFMRIDDRATAMQLAVEFAQRYWLFKIGYDESYRKCSPGTLLMLHTLGYAAERGLRAYELLGDVEAWIADFWTREQHDCVRLRSYPFNVRGAVAFAADAAIWLWHRLWRRTAA